MISPAPAAGSKGGWLSRLRHGLEKTRVNIVGLFSGGVVDANFLDELEMALISADVGVATAARLIDSLRTRIKLGGLKTQEEVRLALRDEITALLQPAEGRFDFAKGKPLVVMVAGVNGAGKTTSIGKLAKWFSDQGKTVLLAAGDTFRAAAREQLAVWGARNNVDVIAQSGGDPAAVIFDAVTAAKSRAVDVRSIPPDVFRSASPDGRIGRCDARRIRRPALHECGRRWRTARTRWPSPRLWAVG
jgi:fused signal recognition particle receptor